MQLIMGAIAPVVAQHLRCSKQLWQLGHKLFIFLGILVSSFSFKFSESRTPITLVRTSGRQDFLACAVLLEGSWVADMVAEVVSSPLHGIQSR